MMAGTQLQAYSFSLLPRTELGLVLIVHAEVQLHIMSAMNREAIAHSSSHSNIANPLNVGGNY
jgi:hypothetical protein